MISEVKEAHRIIKVINEHLAEQPECKHDLKTIMREAIENKIGLGNQPNPDDAVTNQRNQLRYGNQ